MRRGLRFGRNSVNPNGAVRRSDAAKYVLRENGDIGLQSGKLCDVSAYCSRMNCINYDGGTAKDIGRLQLFVLMNL